MDHVNERCAAAVACSAFGLTAAFAVCTAVAGFVDHGTEVPAPESGEINALSSLGFGVMIVASPRSVRSWPRGGRAIRSAGSSASRPSPSASPS